MPGRGSLGLGAPVGRRQLLAAGAGWWAVGALRAAGPRGAAPTLADPVITLYYSAGGYESTRSTASLDAIIQLLDTYFVSRHPGIRLKVNWNFHGNSQGLIAAMLAGVAPDVFEEYHDLPLLVSQGLLLDLTPYIQADNINLDEFLPGEIAAFRSVNASGIEGQYGLPAYVHQFAMMVNLGVLDQLGLPYPSETWDYQEAETLWRKVAGPIPGTTDHRYGSNFVWQQDGPSAFYLHGWGGAYVDPRDAARCALDQPGSIAAGEWIFGLIAEQICTNDFSPYTNGGQHFLRGELVCQWAGTNGEMVPIASGLRDVKFRFYPMPRWPQGWYAHNANDFHAIWSGTKYPDAAWELLRFLATSKDWQRGLIKLYLAGPALNSLWPEYVRTVEEYAPPLRGKNLEAFIFQVEHHMPIFRSYFKYASESAFQIISRWTTKILDRQVSVADGFTEAARQVNAFEAAQAAASAQAAVADRALAALIAKAKASPNLVLPAPPAQGPGIPARPDAGALRVAAGTYTLTGIGSGLQGTDDGGVFAGMPWTRSRGVFTCRVAAIANGNSPSYLASGAAVGLMARADLGSEAPEVALVIQSNRGVHLHVRALTSLPVADQRPRNYGGGLLPASAILHDGHHPHANYLLRPVWLRLQQVGNVWTAFTSLDGVQWTAAGLPSAIEAASVWIGLFVSPHDASFSDKPYSLIATFDHLDGFAPTTVVQIGAP
jgi:multiple sugar transport system substrate-binding protein